MVNSQFVKDTQKGVTEEPLKQVLAPGATPRRYEPECGIKKHNERIHRESSYADTHKNLPFTFRKPPKAMGRNVVVQCDNCGHIITGTTATVGVICKSCENFSSVSEVVFDGQG